MKWKCVVMSLLMVVFLMGCAAAQMSEAETADLGENAELEMVSESSKTTDQAESTEEDQDSVSAENVPQVVDWSVLKEQLRPCIVQIYCGNQEGSGVIWSIDGSSLEILSVRHLLEAADTGKVFLVDQTGYEASVTFVSKDYDIAMLSIPINQVGEETLKLIKEVSLPQAYEKEKDAVSEVMDGGNYSLVTGQELAILGSVEMVGDSFVQGYLEQVEVSPSEMSTATGRNLIGNSVMVGHGKVCEGMSGSGVFTTEGYFVGLMTGGDGEEHFSAVQIWNILTEITK